MSKNKSFQRGEPFSFLEARKIEAKLLLKEYHSGEVKAREVVEKHWKPKGKEEFALHDAQWVIARQNNHQTWAELKFATEGRQKEYDEWLSGGAVNTNRMGGHNVVTNKPEESMEFYSTVLGFEGSRSKDGGCYVRHKRYRLTINFLRPKREGRYAIHKSFHTPFNGAGLSLTFVVPDMYAAYEFVKSKGVPIAMEPMTVPWGESMFAICDPNGIAIYLVHPKLDDKMLQAHCEKHKIG